MSQIARPSPYRLTSTDLRLPHVYVGARAGRTTSTGQVPVSLWPDGSVCWPATMYLCAKYRAGKSTRTRGGTLATYAKQLGHLIRFCYSSGRDFQTLNDADIDRWIEQLLAEETVDSHQRVRLARNATQVGVVGRRALDFLTWVEAMLAPNTGLIGVAGDGCQITVELKTFRKRGKSSTFLSHPSFPTRDATRRRTPVTKDQIDRLFAANLASRQSDYIKRRRSVMVHLALATGGRRLEMAFVTVDQILLAAESGLLPLDVVKSRSGKVREIPVVRSRLEPILSFIRGHRAKLIRSTVGTAGDCGRLFLTASGHPLSEETLTNDMHDLATLAGLEVRACLHMFRHRFFTDMAYHFLLGIREFAERRELTAPSERLVLQEMRTLSGHASDESLLRYIHAAYKEASAWETGERSWRIAQLHQVMTDTLCETDALFRSGAMNAAQVSAHLQNHLGQWKTELGGVPNVQSGKAETPP